jgi:hypothetical protein
MNTMMICILILSIYVAIESWLPICKMGGGLSDFCHKAKYAVALLSSIAFATYASCEILALPQLLEIDWLVFGCIGTMALFVWPRTVYRLRMWHDIIAFKSGLHHCPHHELRHRFNKTFRKRELSQ